MTHDEKELRRQLKAKREELEAHEKAARRLRIEVYKIITKLPDWRFPPRGFH